MVAAHRAALTARLVVAAATITTVITGASDAAAAYPDGFYISIGLGYAHVLGERGVDYQVPSTCNRAGGYGDDHFLWLEDGWECWTVSAFSGASGKDDIDVAHGEMARTDFGSGLGIQLTLGYNILGYVSPELSILGNGEDSLGDGAAHIGFVVRYHLVEHFITHTERDWDANVFFGVGYSIGGYHPDEQIQNADDGKGWEGYNFTFGAGFDYAVLDFLSVGLDMHFVMPRWQSWIVNFDNGVRSTPTETPLTVIIAPLVHVKFHP